MGGRGERSPRSRDKKVETAEVEHKTVYSQRGEHEFEYDIVKSRTNKEKHGIDFEEAQALWNDEKRYEVPANSSDESRMATVGKVGDKYYFAVTTERGDNIRIISVRRARAEEVSRYE